MPELRRYHTQGRTTMTIAEAARQLEVTRRTFDKWVALGFVKLVEVGPADAKIRRVSVREVARLKREG